MVHWTTALDAAQPPQVNKYPNSVVLDGQAESLTTTGADEVIKTWKLKAWQFDATDEDEFLRVRVSGRFVDGAENKSLSVKVGAGDLWALAADTHTGDFDVTIVADVDADAGGLVASYFGHIDGTLEAGINAPTVDMTIDQDITVVGQGVATDNITIEHFSVELIK